MNRTISGFPQQRAQSQRFTPVFSASIKNSTVEYIPSPRKQTQNAGFSSGACSIIGKRPSNEDRELIISNSQFKLYAVFDGHGGDQAAAYCYANFVSIFQQQIVEKAPEVALQATCLILDNQFSKLTRFSSVGTTANMVLFYQNNVYYCNVGDSRCIIHFGDQFFASTDHTPSHDRQRLTALGVRVLKCMGIDRVDGNLALARAIGDQYMAHLGIIAQGDSGIICPLDQVNFIVVACDGLYGVFSNKQIIDIITSCLTSIPVPGAPQKLLLEAAIAYFCGDNMKGDLLLGKVVGQRIYRTRVCCDVDTNATPATKLSQILCKFAYWKNSMDNVSVIVILK